ncbi:MAG: hypothetical protein ABIJ92_01930 [Candidatus Aenigmatarchaeota archaeon]
MEFDEFSDVMSRGHKNRLDDIRYRSALENLYASLKIDGLNSTDHQTMLERYALIFNTSFDAGDESGHERGYEDGHRAGGRELAEDLIGAGILGIALRERKNTSRQSI